MLCLCCIDTTLRLSQWKRKLQCNTFIHVVSCKHSMIGPTLHGPIVHIIVPNIRLRWMTYRADTKQIYNKNPNGFLFTVQEPSIVSHLYLIGSSQPIAIPNKVKNGLVWFPTQTCNDDPHCEWGVPVETGPWGVPVQFRFRASNCLFNVNKIQILLIFALHPNPSHKLWNWVSGKQ